MHDALKPSHEITACSSSRQTTITPTTPTCQYSVSLIRVDSEILSGDFNLVDPGAFRAMT